MVLFLEEDQTFIIHKQPIISKWLERNVKDVWACFKLLLGKCWHILKVISFIKLNYELAPSYLPDHLPEQSVNITTPFSRIEMYCNSFFPYCIENWNKLDNSVRIKNILILSFVQKGNVFMV